MLEAVRDGRMLFAVDQQPYLQGYLPVMLLAERARYGVFPRAGELIPTGPQFVTTGDAADELIELSAEGFGEPTSAGGRIRHRHDGTSAWVARPA